MNNWIVVLSIAFWFPSSMFSQEEDHYDNEEYQILESINDQSSEGQRMFVEQLLDIAGYVPEKIDIYQTLQNSARVYRVRLDSINSGFVFVRWNSTKKENFIANRLIDPELYYNLNTARKIMRKQTDKASFSVHDVSLQAPDQKIITPEALNQYIERSDKIEKLKNSKKQSKRRRKYNN